jgi:hypothetical protein
LASEAPQYEVRLLAQVRDEPTWEELSFVFAQSDSRCRRAPAARVQAKAVAVVLTELLRVVCSACLRGKR